MSYMQSGDYIEAWSLLYFKQQMEARNKKSHIFKHIMFALKQGFYCENQAAVWSLFSTKLVFKAPQWN